MREEREEERELCVLCVGKQATAQSNTKSWQQKTNFKRSVWGNELNRCYIVLYIQSIVYIKYSMHIVHHIYVW